MSTSGKKGFLVAAVGVALLAVICAYAAGQMPAAQLQINGAIITSKVYEIDADGNVTDDGSITTYLSTNGNYRQVTQDANGKVTREVIADASQKGVYVVDRATAQAERRSTFNPNKRKKFDAETLLNHPQFVRQETILGYQGYVLQLKTPDGRIDNEFTVIPQFESQPVKQVKYYENGGKRIVEPVSIQTGEPAAHHFKLPTNFRKYDSALSPRESLKDQ